MRTIITCLIIQLINLKNIIVMAIINTVINIYHRFCNLKVIKLFQINFRDCTNKKSVNCVLHKSAKTVLFCTLWVNFFLDRISGTKEEIEGAKLDARLTFLNTLKTQF